MQATADQARGQQSPTATYNTDAFDYWHLDGETWATKLPPIGPAAEANLRALGHSLAQTAAMWGFSLPTFYALRYNDALGANPKAPPGQIWRMSDISTPKLSQESGYVTPNVNTVYGFGFMDLGPEPIVLTVPNSHGRYYMVEILDAYFNAFAYAGGVATGYDGGEFVLIGPGWKGTLPAGMRRIYAPTRWLLLQPRVHIKNPADLPGAKATLSSITTQPLSTFLGTPAPAPAKYNYPVPKFADPKLPVSANSYTDPLQFWDMLSDMLNENPPPQDQITALLPLFAPLGIELGKKWDRTKVNPNILAGMKQAAEEIGMTIVQIPPGQMKNGWVFCWPSTGNFRTDYMNRATIDRWGLTANTLEEAIYLGSYYDADNKPLMGENAYTLTLKPPPFKEPGFWSATMYSYDNNYTVENPINRYCLGSDDPLTVNQDGTVTLYMQSTSPGAGKEANWLPSPPSGRWYILLRSYAPAREAVEASFDPSVWAPGAVTKVTGTADAPHNGHAGVAARAS
jgi:hypothetical protein